MDSTVKRSKTDTTESSIMSMIIVHLKLIRAQTDRLMRQTVAPLKTSYLVSSCMHLYDSSLYNIKLV